MESRPRRSRRWWRTCISSRRPRLGRWAAVSPPITHLPHRRCRRIAAGAAAASRPRRSRRPRRWLRIYRAFLHRCRLPWPPSPLPPRLATAAPADAAAAGRAGPGRAGPGPGAIGFLHLTGIDKYTELLRMDNREPNRLDLSGQRRHFQAIVCFLVLYCEWHCSYFDAWFFSLFQEWFHFELYCLYIYMVSIVNVLFSIVVYYLLFYLL